MAYESLCDKDVLWEIPTEEQLELEEEKMKYFIEEPLPKEDLSQE